MNNFASVIVGVILMGLIVGIGIYSWPPGGQNKIINTEDLSLVKSLPIPEVLRVSEVDYFSGARGYYVEPTAGGVYPGIVMIHEWWGLNDYIRDTARMLASEGFKVLAVDLFGGVATTIDEARRQVEGLDQDEALANLRAAVKYLRDQNVTRIGSLGWCFGGGQSMQLAVSGDDLNATVIYYGNLVTDSAKLKNIKWPLLGIFGAADEVIKSEMVREFDAALDDAGVKNYIYSYPGMAHAFANPTGPNYASGETLDAWSKTLKFLNDNLK